MAWQLIDGFLASLLALTIFFVLVGVLVLFAEDLELKLVIGAGSILIGIGVLLYALDFPEFSLLLVGVMAALVVRQVLEYFTVY